MKLNHKYLAQLMRENGLRPVDLARKMNMSPQATDYMLKRGGVSYADRLAKIFKVDRLSLIK